MLSSWTLWTTGTGYGAIIRDDVADFFLAVTDGAVTCSRSSVVVCGTIVGKTIVVPAEFSFRLGISSACRRNQKESNGRIDDLHGYDDFL